MTQRRLPLWILLIIIPILLIQSKEGNHGPTIDIDYSTLQDHIWVEAFDGYGTENASHRNRELVFLSQNKFEIRETFSFSGSTFRNPGTYSLGDSLVRLKSNNGRVHIGNISIHNNRQLRIKWAKAGQIYGEGTEIFRAENMEPSDKPRIFSSRVFQLFR